MANLEDAPAKETSPAATPPQLIGAIGAGYGVLGIAAYVGALAVHGFGEPGLILLWLGGFLSGKAALLVLKEARSQPVGWALAVGCFLAVAFIEVYYIRFKIVGGEDGWLASLKMLPRFLQQFKISAIVAIIAATLGAMSAYGQAARRYRYVRVEDIAR